MIEMMAMMMYTSFILAIFLQQTIASDVSHRSINGNDNSIHGNGNGNSNIGPNYGMLLPHSNQIDSNLHSMSHGYNDKRNGFAAMYQNVQMFQPVSQADHSSGSMNSSRTANVMVQIQLKNYIDQGLQLPNGQTCVCPSGFSCRYLGSNIPRCLMSFTIIVSSPSESVKYLSTDFMPLTPSGTIDINDMSQQQQQAWQQPYTFYLASKPSAIDIFVHHIGIVIDAQTGELTQMQAVVHVDTFTLPLNSIVPSIGKSLQSMQSRTLTGVILQTQLTLAYSVQCISALIGPDCDLTCNTSTVNSATAMCRSNITNFFYTCTYTGSGQVENCLACPWGIAEGSYCQNSNGGILDASTAGVVSSSFRVATIVLGILVGILLIFLILLIIFTILMSRRMREDEPRYNGAAPGHNYRSTLRSEGSANRPLLQSTYNESHNGQAGRAPIAPPRSVPQLDAVPTKSSLRKATPIPPAHLGGASSLNDTLNSTLSSVPLPPSKEADV